MKENHILPKCWGMVLSGNGWQRPTCGSSSLQVNSALTLLAFRIECFSLGRRTWKLVDDTLYLLYQAFWPTRISHALRSLCSYG